MSRPASSADGAPGSQPPGSPGSEAMRLSGSVLKRESSGVTTPKSAARTRQACWRSRAGTVASQAVSSALRSVSSTLRSVSSCSSSAMVKTASAAYCSASSALAASPVSRSSAAESSPSSWWMVCCRCADPKDQALGLGPVLRRTTGVELLVGPCLFGPVAGGVATRLHELRMGDPSGRSTEDDCEDRSKRDEDEGAGQQGTCNHERRDNEQRNGGQKADAVLTATGIGGTHVTQIKRWDHPYGPDTHVRAPPLRGSGRAPASAASSDRPTPWPGRSVSRPIQLTAYPA